MEEYRILKDLISFNTIKDKENKKIIEYIERYLKSYGFKTKYKGKYLIMSIGKNQKLGFLGHTDTVESVENWNSNPFKLTKVDNKLYGLGVCDMKSGIAAILEAVSQIDFTKLKYGIKLYFTYDEEIGFNGINNIINTDERFPNTMIIGEPTNNEILNGSKGLLEYELYFNGIKAHSSNPEKGRSANLNAIKFISELTNFYELKIKKEQDINYDIPYTTMNVGIINGGNSINCISDNCFAAIDFRLVRNSHIEIINKKINELSKKYDCTIKIIEKISPFINKIDITKENMKVTNYITEASFIKNSKKIILGAGPITAHEANEYISIESYNMLITQYKAIIMKICKYK